MNLTCQDANPYNSTPTVPGQNIPQTSTLHSVPFRRRYRGIPTKDFDSFTMATSTDTYHPIAWYHRIGFTWIEPILAIGGVIQTLFTPYKYLAIAHPNLTWLLDTPNATNALVRPALQTLFTCIAGGWSILTFNDVVTLRVFSREPRVWQCIIAAHLISDTVYCLALIQDVGAAQFFNPMTWNAMDWLTQLTTLPPMALKIAFLLGVGVDYSQRGATPTARAKRG